MQVGAKGAPHFQGCTSDSMLEWESTSRYNYENKATCSLIESALHQPTNHGVPSTSSSYTMGGVAKSRLALVPPKPKEFVMAILGPRLSF